MLMNVQTLKQTNVIPKRCAPTLTARMSVAVLLVIKAMGETAQVYTEHETIQCNKDSLVPFQPKYTFSCCNQRFVDSCGQNVNLIYLFSDVDECAIAETNECHSNAVCNNTGGSYVCRCKSGFQGDGRNCTGE